MVLIRLYGKLTKWDSDVPDILEIFLLAMVIAGRVDQPMTRGHISKLPEDINRNNTD